MTNELAAILQRMDTLGLEPAPLRSVVELPSAQLFTRLLIIYISFYKRTTFIFHIAGNCKSTL